MAVKTIDDYKNDWAAANAAGDTAGMEAAHAAAEALRAQAGYSGGADGSQYIPLSTTPTTQAATTVASPTATTFNGSATGVGVYNTTQAAIQKLMNENSQKWWTANAEEREALHAQNEQLAALLGGSVSYDSSTGTWNGSASTPVSEIAPYSSPYSTQIDSLLQSVLNRQPFSYDYTTDPSYLAYEDKYKRLGDRAREDTLGDVAALNGGYASSWAVSAASQAQNDYNQQLSDIIPTLYDAAYNRYLTEDSLLRSDLGLLMDVDNTNYSRYRDTVGDAQWQTNFDYDAYRDSVGDSQWKQTFDRSVYESDRSYERGVYESDRSFDWQQYTDKWNMSNTEATQKFEQLMSKWQLTGVADAEVAAELGVPVGATTESYYFNKASQELDEAKFEYSKEQDKKTGSGGGGGTSDYTATKGREIVLGMAKDVYTKTSAIGSTRGYSYAAKVILQNAGTYGLDMEDYFSMCEELGIPTETANSVWTANLAEYNAAKDKGETETNDYDYYVKQMGAAADPETWLENNKYSLPDGMYEKLSKLL